MFRASDKQASLFQTAHFLPSEKRERLEQEWPGLFFREILPLIKEGVFAELYDAGNGRPNKSVRLVVGVLLLKEMFDLTDQEALWRLDYDFSWHVALGAEPDVHCCQKTLHNFRAKLLKSTAARQLFEDLTQSLIKRLGLQTEQQRLDSTHIISNIARLSRLGLFCETMRVFLRELKRRDQGRYEGIPPSLRKRYLQEDGKDSGYDDAPGSATRRRLNVCGRDLYRLVKRFEKVAEVNKRDSYGLLVRLLAEQCEVQTVMACAEAGDADEAEEPVPVVLKESKEVGSSSLQSPHDPDVTYSGHKGKGYEVQVAETVGNGEKPELITHVEVTAASSADEAIPVPLVRTLREAGLQPKELIADAGYASTANVLDCAAQGTELLGPVKGAKKVAAQQAVAQAVSLAVEAVTVPEPEPEAPVVVTAADETQATAAGETQATAEQRGAADVLCGKPVLSEGATAKSEQPTVEADRQRIDSATLADFRLDLHDESKGLRCPAGRNPEREERTAKGVIMASYAREDCAHCALRGCCAAQQQEDGTRILRTTKVEWLLAYRRWYEETKAFWERYAVRAGIEGTNSELKRAHGLGKLRVRGEKRVKLAVYLKATACNLKRALKYMAQQARKSALFRPHASMSSDKAAGNIIRHYDFLWPVLSPARNRKNFLLCA